MSFKVVDSLRTLYPSHVIGAVQRKIPNAAGSLLINASGACSTSIKRASLRATPQPQSQAAQQNYPVIVTSMMCFWEMNSVM
jgi:hypothetical protein